MKVCQECLGDGYIQCPSCDGEGEVEGGEETEEDKARYEQLRLPGVDWSEFEQQPGH